MIRFGNKIRTCNNPDVEYWVTSDLHFWHKGVLNFCPDTRPWSDVEEMNEALIEEWNTNVKPNDEVLHLGDFCFKGKEATMEIINRLNGNITWVLGNHDKVLRGNIGGAVDFLEFRFNSTKVVCSHYPLASWNQQGRGSVMLHGHCHGSYQGKGKTIDVGYDRWGRIMRLGEVIERCLERPTYCPDHHKEV